MNAVAAAIDVLVGLAKRTSTPSLQLGQADVNRIAAAVASLLQSKGLTTPIQTPAEGAE
jgi:hypothetical protein